MGHDNLYRVCLVTALLSSASASSADLISIQSILFPQLSPRPRELMLNFD
jgi:hypothetical protein